MTETYNIPEVNSLNSMEGMPDQQIEQDNITDSIIEDSEKQDILIRIKEELEKGAFSLWSFDLDEVKKIGLENIIDNKLMPILTKTFVDYVDRVLSEFEVDFKKDERYAFSKISQTILHMCKHWSTTFMERGLRGKVYDAEIGFVAKLEECFGGSFYSAANAWKYLGDENNQRQVEGLMDRFYGKDGFTKQKELDIWLRDNFIKHVDDLRKAYHELGEVAKYMDVDTKKLTLEVLIDINKKLEDLNG